MKQQTCVNESNLRVELGRLRHERHEIDHRLSALEAELQALKNRKNLNGKQLKIVERQLVHHACPAGVQEPELVDLSAQNEVGVVQTHWQNDLWLVGLGFSLVAAAILAFFGWLPGLDS